MATKKCCIYAAFGVSQTPKEISVLKGETIEYVKSVYDILNDRCFIYFSDF